MPAYRVELAKSNRSKCTQKTKAARKCPAESKIDKGEVRVGWLNQESGTYGRWCHLMCWRVPSRIWMGLPADALEAQNYDEIAQALASMNEVLFCGFNELSE